MMRKSLCVVGIDEMSVWKSSRNLLIITVAHELIAPEIEFSAVAAATINFSSAPIFFSAAAVLLVCSFHGSGDILRLLMFLSTD
jgi:hypothetical protein